MGETKQLMKSEAQFVLACKGHLNIEDEMDMEEALYSVHQAYYVLSDDYSTAQRRRDVITILTKIVWKYNRIRSEYHFTKFVSRLIEGTPWDGPNEHDSIARAITTLGSILMSWPVNPDYDGTVYDLGEVDPVVQRIYEERMGEKEK